MAQLNITLGQDKILQLLEGRDTKGFLWLLTQEALNHPLAAESD